MSVQCSLFQVEILNNFCIFVVPTYDIYNEILKLDQFGHFYFLASVASFRGH